MTRLVTSLLFVLVLAACGSSDQARCDTCGMIVEPDSGWRAGAEGTAFDSPKCMFRHRLRHGDLEAPWVIEYYSQTRHDAETLFYVTGTDLESPMGRDLVPVEGRENAERLRTDHGGDRVLGWAEVDARVIDPLFQ
ncbi:MAG: nitrous oxide reductase accessory protein NosL [Sandaracinaceae bacterium]